MKKIKFFVAFIFLAFGFASTSQAQCFTMDADVSEVSSGNYIVTVTVTKIGGSTVIIDAEGHPTKYCSNSCTLTFNYKGANVTGDVYIQCRSGSRGSGCFQVEGCVITITPPARVLPLQALTLS